MTDEGFYDRQREAWSRPPVDDVGYIPATELLAKPDDELRAIVEQMRTTRYTGWRNHGGLWRDLMGLDEPGGRDILDFGCGTGVEALELTLAGNRVDLADINLDNLHLAGRILGLHVDEIPDRHALTAYLALGESPYIEGRPERYDVFHCNGVLHHIPWARQIMERAHQILRPDGIARLMLYSERGWIQATGTEPPDDVTADPGFERFVRHFDQVGEYADWYSRDRIEQRFGDLFTVERCEYLTPTGQYLAAVLRKREAAA
ncbi:class I SAM-dependent methyltransferase [Streptomyces sp. NPDC020747]|uniref:class I SAM-dependent methyltransferase n=1 Tax=Streptomyces sp. NPDC020747 TaxID=3365086 RepID=UPI0037B7FEC4